MSKLQTQAQIDSRFDERLRSAVAREVFSSKVVGEPFAVKHAIGSIPRFAYALPTTAANVWAEEVDRRLWSETAIVLRCSVASVKMDVLIVE